jgi:hypothetical protein
MEIKFAPSNLENKVYLHKISKTVTDLSFITDPLFFVRKMVRLSALLNSLDLDNSFPTIDENLQDPTYFLVAYFDTKNMAEALWVYKIVRSLTKYILLSDRYYETGNDRYALAAKRVHRSVSECLRSESESQYLIYSIDYSLRQFSAFWKFEQLIKGRITNNHIFSYIEIRHYNLSKSSDASLVYAKVLDAKLRSFNENVALVLHYNQALLDIQDDWEDIEDDVRDDMPNIFVMAAIDKVPYSKIKKTRHDKIREVVLNETNSSARLITRLVNETEASVKGISIPSNFAFLKCLSDLYADTLRRKISSG